jgi:hypothetical protein
LLPNEYLVSSQYRDAIVAPSSTRHLGRTFVFKCLKDFQSALQSANRSGTDAWGVLPWGNLARKMVVKGYGAKKFSERNPKSDSNIAKDCLRDKPVSVVEGV